MTSFVIGLHIIVCILLILIVLIQGGKGAEMGISMGGGSSQTLFGASGPATILTKITTGVAIVFMATALTLAYFSGHQTDSSVITGNPVPVQQTTEKTDN